MPDAAIGLNAGSLQFVTNDPDIQIKYDFVDEIKIKFPKIVSKSVQLLHMGSNFFLLNQVDHLTVVGCTRVGDIVRCSVVFSKIHDVIILSSIYHDGHFYILST